MTQLSDQELVVATLDIGLRYLQIWIGHYEADQIQMQLAGTPGARPLTYRYFANFFASDGDPVGSRAGNTPP